tara:strand:- start:56 stop:307 length:252 start_codon:yes stop_codon:yes gene_type:complete
MKNILNQLGATATNLEGATPQEMQALGMNLMGPAVQGPMTTNPATLPVDPFAIPPVNPTANNFSPTTKSVADYTYGSDVARGY